MLGRVDRSPTERYWTLAQSECNPSSGPNRPLWGITTIEPWLPTLPTRLISLNIYSFEPHRSLIWSFIAIFFVTGFMIVGAVPLLTLLATTFPSCGRYLASFLDRVSRPQSNSSRPAEVFPEAILHKRRSIC